MGAVLPAVVGVALVVATWPSSAALFLQQPNLRLKEDDVGHTLVHARPCKCRAICYVDPECRAYSVKPVTIAQTDNSRALNEPLQRYLCSFAAVGVTRDDLLAEMDSGVVTYLRGAACPTDFVEVPQTGCFFVSTGQVSQSKALDLCPTGSELFSPSLSQPWVYWSLTHYLKFAGRGDNFWTSMKWNGSLFTSSGGSSLTATVGEGFWGSSDPNGYKKDQQCVAIWKSQIYGLVDTSCNDSTQYICHHK